VGGCSGRTNSTGEIGNLVGKGPVNNYGVCVGRARTEYVAGISMIVRSRWAAIEFTYGRYVSV
jgi:hypothetical protein